MITPITGYIFNLDFKTKAEKISYNSKILAHSLQICYPDRWYLLIERETTAKVEIWFPVLQITNSQGDQHTITELFVCFYIDLLTSRLTSDYDSIQLKGIRMSGTRKEIRAGYTHSHLSTSDFASSGSFCFGAAPIKLTMMEISSEYKPVYQCIEKIEYFLIQLEEYLSWESIEGTPHRRMSSIGVRSINSTNIHREESYISLNTYRNIDSALGINPLGLKRIFKSFILSLVKNKYLFTAAINIVTSRHHPGAVIQLSEVGCDYLVNTIIKETASDHLSKYLCLEDDSGRLSAYSQNTEDQMEHHLRNLKTRNKKFRDSEIYFKVINDEKPKEKANERLYQRLRPRFKKLFEAYLTTWLYAHKLGKGQTSDNSKDNNPEW